MKFSILIERAATKLLRERLPTQSICPSEIARSLVTPPANWRELMPEIRAVAFKLASDDRVIITQGTKIVDPRHIPRGPIRLRRGSKFPED